MLVFAAAAAFVWRRQSPAFTRRTTPWSSLWRRFFAPARELSGGAAEALGASGAQLDVPVSLKLKPGRSLAQKYRLVQRLGHDGTVEVWKAHDETLDRPALVQRLFAGPEQPDERFQRLDDARLAATLHHPNVTDVYEILDLPSGLFIVYEYTPGKTVRQILAEMGKLPTEQVRDILIPVCRALEHAHHRGVAHGGLSPERIIVTKQGYIKVGHFVLARTTGEGAERYAAPEVKRGEALAFSDIYSLGMCCYEMLTGALPNVGADSADPRIVSLLEKSLDLDYRTRLSSPKEFRRLLRKIAAPFAGLNPNDPPDEDQTATEATA